MRSRHTRRCWTESIQGTVFLIRNGIRANPSHLILVVSFNWSLPILASILFVSLMMRIYILLFHSQVMFLLHKRWLVSIQVTNLFLLIFTFLVCINCRGAVLCSIIHLISWITHISWETTILNLWLAWNCIIVFIATTAYVVIRKQTVLLLLFLGILVWQTIIIGLTDLPSILRILMFWRHWCTCRVVPDIFHWIYLRQTSRSIPAFSSSTVYALTTIIPNICRNIDGVATRLRY